MKEKVYTYYKDLPSWAKGVVVIGVLGGGFLIVKSFIDRLKREAERKKAEQDIVRAKDELQQLQEQGEATTFNKSTYDAFAQSLVDQFDGCDFFVRGPFGIDNYEELSTSAKKLYDIVKQLNNDRDFLELVDSFGLRTYDDCGWGTGEVSNATLFKAVSNELDTDEIQYINRLLSNRGISYKF